MVLEQFEFEERFEECNIIYNVIVTVSNQIGFPLPTKYSKETVEFIKNEINRLFQISKRDIGENIIQQSQYYADIIYQELTFNKGWN